MTGGTLFLYWVGKLTPVTPLRAKSPAGWSQILVRAADPGTEDGFYHVKLDAGGGVSASSAWRVQRYAQQGDGVIHVLVRCPKPGARVTPEQTKVLTQLLSELRQTYDIPASRVRVTQPSQLAGLNNPLD